MERLTATQEAARRQVQNLAEMIESYWRDRGHPEVKAWPTQVMQISRGVSTLVWVVGSNLVAGQPPPKSQKGPVSVAPAKTAAKPAVSAEPMGDGTAPRPLTVIEKNVLGVLRLAANAEGIAQISIIALADVAGCHNTTAKSAVGLLLERSFIEVVDHGASRRAALYRILKADGE